MRLSIVDRIIILNSILPETGTIKALKIIKSIRNKIDFSTEEYNSFKLTVPYRGMIQIDEVTEDMKKRDTYYNFTDEEIKTLSDCASIQDQNGWVTESSLDTIEMLLDYSTEDTIKTE